MKHYNAKILMTALLSTAFSLTAGAQSDANFLLEQYFNYTTSANLDDQTNWAVSTKDAEKVGLSPVVKAGNLSYPLYAGSGEGNSAYLNATDQSVTENAHITLFTFTDGGLPTDKALYAAFLVNVSEMNNITRDIFCYNNGNTANRGRVWVKVADGTNAVNFAVTKSNATSVSTVWSAELDKTKSLLLVLKYINKSTSSSGTPDEYYLYVNPDPTKSEEDNASCKLTAEDNANNGGATIKRVGLKTQTKTKATFSGMRISRTWGQALAVGLTIGETGWATFSAKQNFTLPDGLKAYVVSSFDSGKGSVALTEVAAIPANQGVLLKGTPSTKYTLIPQAADPDVGTNLLAMNLTAAVLPQTDGGNTNFILVPDGAGSVKFAKPNGTGSLAANKAYLQVPTGDLSGHELTISFADSETTGIGNLTPGLSQGEGVCFDLQGRKLSGKPTKGLYIVNGKKVIIK